MFSVLTILYRSIAVSEDVVLKYSMYMSGVRFKKIIIIMIIIIIFSKHFQCYRV